jgi:hypothetical protein
VVRAVDHHTAGNSTNAHDISGKVATALAMCERISSKQSPLAATNQSLTPSSL